MYRKSILYYNSCISNNIIIYTVKTREGLGQ